MAFEASAVEPVDDADVVAVVGDDDGGTCYVAEYCGPDYCTADYTPENDVSVYP